MVRRYVERFGVQTALLSVAVIWGWAFVAVAEAIERWPMYSFLAWRFALASAAFVIFYPKVLKRLTADNVKTGLIAGVLLSAGYILQTAGLDGPGRTTPARAAFITGLYVVITPLVQAVILKRRPRKATLVGGAIALAGLWVLSGIGRSMGTWVSGDTLVVLCAFAFTAHIIVLGSTHEGHDVSALTLVQLATVAVVCGLVSLVKEHAGVPTDPSVILAIVVTGVFASALAFVVQTWAQRELPPARVALILVTETAWGGIFGWAAASTPPPPSEVIGAATMFVGLIVSEAVAAMSGDEAPIALEPAVEGMPPVVLGEDSSAVLGTTDPQDDGRL